MNLYSNETDGPVITIHNLPQDVSFHDLKKHVRMKVPGACLKAGFFWMKSKGKQLHVLNSDQDLSEAKRKQTGYNEACCCCRFRYECSFCKTNNFAVFRKSWEHNLGRDFESMGVMNK